MCDRIIPGWENTYAPLEADFGVPVSVDNDANSSTGASLWRWTGI